MGGQPGNAEAGSGPVQLIHARYVVPVRPAGVVYEDHSVVVGGTRILAVLPREDAERTWPAGRAIELPDHVLLPGLVNSHTHAPMTLLRGYADDLELHVWLRDHIWPAEREFVGPEFVRDGVRLALAEMFRGGTTCFNDMYFFPDTAIEACLEAGMRASIGITVIEIESAWAKDVDSYIDKGLDLHQAYHAEPLISLTLSPHAPYTVSDRTLGRIAALSGELQLPVHMHLLETQWEIKHSLQQHDHEAGQRILSAGGAAAGRRECRTGHRRRRQQQRPRPALGGTVRGAPGQGGRRGCGSRRRFRSA
jgi:5-methylthioadenosine/S-adenosylhomocysteine deaminase